MMLVKYRHSTGPHNTGSTRLKRNRDRKLDSNSEQGGQQAEAAGESHYSRKHKARKPAPPPSLNCGSAEAGHGFKCGNLRGRTTDLFRVVRGRSARSDGVGAN